MLSYTRRVTIIYCGSIDFFIFHTYTYIVAQFDLNFMYGNCVIHETYWILELK